MWAEGLVSASEVVNVRATLVSTGGHVCLCWRQGREMVPISSFFFFLEESSHDLPFHMSVSYLVVFFGEMSIQALCLFFRGIVCC